VFSQEVRLSSASSSWLKWTVGAYFFNQVYNVRTATVYVPPLGLLFGYTGTDVSQSDRDNTGIAGFGQASVPLTPQVELTVGLRYDYESKRAQVALFNLDDSGNKTYKRPEERKSKTFEAFSPKAVIRYSIENNQQLYVSYARGYRAGGINMFANVEGYETFKPEFSDNYEVGYKTFSKDKKFMLTACFFLMHWTNLQLDYRPSSGNSWVTDNLGGVRSHGAELELTIAPLRRFTIEGSLGMIDARYEDFEYIDLQIGGNRTILAPDITSLIAPQYVLTLSKQKNISVLFRGEWRHVGNQYFDLANTINQPAYNLFNARVGLRSKKAELFLWRQNINNVKFISYAAPAYFRYSLLGRPGSWGVTLTAKI
jgi:iron complex outermembrane receptor protein